MYKDENLYIIKLKFKINILYGNWIFCLYNCIHTYKLILINKCITLNFYTTQPAHADHHNCLTIDVWSMIWWSTKLLFCSNRTFTKNTDKYLLIELVIKYTKKRSKIKNQLIK